MLHLDLKVAHKTFHTFHLALGEGMNQGMLLHFLQFWGKDGGRLLQIGKSSIELCQMAPQGRGFFNEIDLET